LEAIRYPAAFSLFFVKISLMDVGKFPDPVRKGIWSQIIELAG
jgi:hypothetical protein